MTWRERLVGLRAGEPVFRYALVADGEFGTAAQVMWLADLLRPQGRPRKEADVVGMKKK